MTRSFEAILHLPLPADLPTILPLPSPPGIRITTAISCQLLQGPWISFLKAFHPVIHLLLIYEHVLGETTTYILTRGIQSMVFTSELQSLTFHREPTSSSSHLVSKPQAHHQLSSTRIEHCHTQGFYMGSRGSVQALMLTLRVLAAEPSPQPLDSTSPALCKLE